MINKIVFFVGCLILTFSCRKGEIKVNESPLLETVESKFFTVHRGGGMQENALVEFIRKLNRETSFIKLTVEKIGYPYWNKMVHARAHLQSASISLAGTTPKQNSTSSQTEGDIFYVPFVREGENHVNASMVIRTSATDTSISYLCDWQYARLNVENGSLVKKENFALFFMNFDRSIFGTKQFVIKDPNIFKINGNKAKFVRLTTSDGISRVNNMVQQCNTISVYYRECNMPPGQCLGPGGSCDDCPLCQAFRTHTYCWDIGEEDDWGDSGGGGYGGGGSGGGGPLPPEPCGGGGEPGGGGEIPQAIGSKKQNNQGVRKDIIRCEDDPGWTPDPYSFEELEAYGNQQGWYWDDPANFTPVEPYDPNRDGPYRSDGFRRNGSIKTFAEGTVQNWINDAGKKIATFIDRSTGDAIDFPDAYITDFFTPYNMGYTTSDGTIHADNTFTLANLQHEYGHVLQLAKYGRTQYRKYIMTASAMSMLIDPGNHIHFWTETEANRMSVEFFGPTSSIASKPQFYPLN